LENDDYIFYNNDCFVDGIKPIYNEKSFNQETCVLYQENKIVEMTEQEKLDMIQNEQKRKKHKPTIEEAVSDFRNGCQEAFDYVYEYYKPKINYMVFSKAEKGKEEEMFSDITMQLFQCMQKYKFGSIKFNTFFWRCAQNVVGIHFTAQTTQKRNNIYGYIPIDAKVNNKKGEGSLIQDIIEDRHATDYFHQVEFECSLNKCVLPKFSDNKDKIIIKMLAKGYMIKDICKELNITSSGVHLRIKKIREKLNYDDFKKLLKH